MDKIIAGNGQIQKFYGQTDPRNCALRVRQLREAMSQVSVDCFLVPRADAHQGENVAACDERLSWLTGFTGSAGTAIVTPEHAGIFVDGRYTIQAREESDPEIFKFLNHPQDRQSDYILSVLQEGSIVAYDPWLHTASEIEALKKALEAEQITLRPADNLVDAAWNDRPAPPGNPITIQEFQFTGKSSPDKRAEVAEKISGSGQSATVLTLLDSIAWLLNIRGSDIDRTPVPRAFAILHANATVDLFTDVTRCDAVLRDHLGPEVNILPPEQFVVALGNLKGTVAVDRDRAPVAVSDRLRDGGTEVIWAQDPCIVPKACKTAEEIAGSRTAHLRDGIAMATFLSWLDREAPGGELSEIDVVRQLEDIRSASGSLRDISFETICGSGPNGAIVHYRVNEKTNRRISPGELLLIDSGGQYSDGTTDITRTVAVGPVPEAAKRPFTLVLKGMIAMSRLRWPQGLAGRDLDAVARNALWQHGLDYNHGTGHGVGSYLGVHEGPAGLSARSTASILSGMILSVEPGYYREGEFGIRTENLCVVREPEIPRGGDLPMHWFETLSFAPIDTRLVDRALLTQAEMDWLNKYHAEVVDLLTPHVNAETSRWLKNACVPV